MGFPCDKDSERMANSQDPDQTAPSEKVIAFICFNFMNKKVFGIDLFFFPSVLWIKHLQIEFDRAKMLSFETSVE